MPVDHRVVLFTVTGAKPAPAELLRRAGVDERKSPSLSTGLCAVKLRVDDGRLRVLLDVLREAGVRPAVRAERRYSDKELVLAPWLLLALPYVGLESLPEQEFDFSFACATCGSGAVPLAPLAVDLAKFGKKPIDYVAYGGHLVVKESLASVLGARATGVRFETVRQRRGLDSRFLWMEAVHTLPAMEPSSVVKRIVCPICRRSGHYDPYTVPLEIHYSQESLDGADDVAKMYEHFGIWKEQRVPIGGSQMYVISQNARGLLSEAGVPRSSFVPITIV